MELATQTEEKELAMNHGDIAGRIVAGMFALFIFVALLNFVVWLLTGGRY
jgi:hypothetical protein